MTHDEGQAISDIITLYRNGDSATEIAERLHLPEATVRHVIEHGTLPEPQPQWPTPE